MPSVVSSGTLLGVDVIPITVEAHLGKGLPGFDIVGLPEASVKEARVRVRSALANQGFELPPRHVVINLAPADLKKRGTGLDLPIAVALLAACGVIPEAALDKVTFVGELGLSGEVRPSRGLLPFLLRAERDAFLRVITGSEGGGHLPWVATVEASFATDLRAVVEDLTGIRRLPRAAEQPVDEAPNDYKTQLDFAQVVGQGSAKRALEIAATGGHNLLMMGPPGAGKSMLASRLCTILPPPTEREYREITAVASASGYEGTASRHRRPFRSPHYSASVPALVGGGDPIQPGEVSLAHGGVLFLDELPEFSRSAVEALRTVTENHSVAITRVRERVTLPARILLLAAMNPCPCGYFGSTGRLSNRCQCSPQRIENYRGKVSGPILDRFDLHVVLPPVELGQLSSNKSAESSKEVRDRVCAARERLMSRGEVSAQELVPSQTKSLEDYVERLAPSARDFLEHGAERLGLSMRGYRKVLRVASTIAALEGSEMLETPHVAEAMSYRQPLAASGR